MSSWDRVEFVRERLLRSEAGSASAMSRMISLGIVTKGMMVVMLLRF